MDLYRIIGELVQERARIARIIESLEEMEGGAKPGRPVRKKAQGRKSMDSTARKEVSERMRKYWAKRRAEKAGKGGQS